eukprot:8911150-Pyramimonas_sp.AAC.1
MAFRTKVRGDTRTNEQCNSVVRVINLRARRIGLDLLSSRVVTKKSMNLGSRGVSCRWFFGCPEGRS